MTKVPYDGNPFGGAQVAAHLGAQSVIQRLNVVVPGRWRQEFRLIEPPPGSKRLYMACRLIVSLPVSTDGPEVEAVYEDVGELDPASRAGLKAIYSDARERAAVAAGLGAYLYTALEPVVLPIGAKDHQVPLIRRTGRADMLALSPATDEWLRRGYERRMATEAVRRDLGDILAHGEPERGMGQGEAAEQADELAAEAVDVAGEATETGDNGREDAAGNENGVVVVDFSGVGPEAA